MRPLPPFNLHRPTSLGEALEMLGGFKGSRPIAGGTDLLPLLREGPQRKDHLVDLSLLGELGRIREVGGEIRIGGAVTHSQLLRSKLISEKAPSLREAAASVGSVQVRNLGTIGGNLCNASPAADTAPPLISLDAKAEAASSDGRRSMPLTELFAGPKLNSLRNGELLTEVRFPTPPEGAGMAFLKLGRRRGFTLSVVNASAYLELDGEDCREVRLSLGSVAPTPLRLHGAEERLRGKRLSLRRIEEAASACLDYVAPESDIRASAEYRREMSRVLARRVLLEAWERARGQVR